MAKIDCYHTSEGVFDPTAGLAISLAYIHDPNFEDKLREKYQEKQKNWREYLENSRNSQRL